MSTLTRGNKGRNPEYGHKNNTARVTIVFAVFALAVVAVFFFISNRSKEIPDGNQKVMTAVQEVIARDLKTNYPPTPKEVLKYYSEITRCFYGENYSDEELIQLAKKSRELFDDELVANQTDEQYLAALQADIASYKDEDKVISSYSVSASTDVNEYSYDGREWAQLYCIYSVRVKTNIAPVQEHFIMRKDAEGHWKILGWKLAENEKTASN